LNDFSQTTDGIQLEDEEKKICEEFNFCFYSSFSVRLKFIFDVVLQKKGQETQSLKLISGLLDFALTL
jgi:hypothetical protein